MTETLTYTKTDIRTAQYNIDSYAMPSGPARGIKTAGKGGQVMINYRDLDQLEGVLRLLDPDM